MSNDCTFIVNRHCQSLSDAHEDDTKTYYFIRRQISIYKHTKCVRNKLKSYVPVSLWCELSYVLRVWRWFCKDYNISALPVIVRKPRVAKHLQWATRSVKNARACGLCVRKSDCPQIHLFFLYWADDILSPSYAIEKTWEKFQKINGYNMGNKLYFHGN